MRRRALALGLLALVASGCFAHRESQASRDRLNCVYAAQYGPGNFTAAERARMEAACR